MRPDRFQRRVHRVMKPFSPAEKDALRRAFRAGASLVCPSCGISLDRSRVPPNPFIPYVRSRVMVTCPLCHGHLVLDRSDHERDRDD